MSIKIFRPDIRKGIFIPQKPNLQAGGPMVQYVQPSTGLAIIDELIHGGKPKILVSRTQGGIGDVLMTLPTVKAIKTKYQGIVDYATDLKYLDGALPKVLLGNSYINEVLDWHKLDTAAYAATIDLTCPCVAHEQPKAPPVNRIDLFAKHAGVELKDHQIDYQVTPEEVLWAEGFLDKKGLTGKKFVLIQPSSSSINRDLPTETLQKAIAQVLGADRTLYAVVLTHKTDSKKTNWRYLNIREARDCDIRQIGAIMTKATLVVCQDSSVLHLAGALNIPTVSMFGPTDPRARVNHYPKACAIWPGGKLACAPSWYSNGHCGMTCWKLITPEMVSETILSMCRTRKPPKQDWIVYYPVLHLNQQLNVPGKGPKAELL